MTVKFDGLTMNQLAECNAELHMQIAELQRKVEALTAECGQMLRLLTDISENHGEFVNEADDYMYASVPLDYVSEINMYVSRDVNAENPFEATDAALAEIRIESACAALNMFEQHCRHLAECSGDKRWVGAGRNAAIYANTIAAGEIKIDLNTKTGERDND